MALCPFNSVNREEIYMERPIDRANGGWKG
jgi:hypothetical protein